MKKTVLLALGIPLLLQAYTMEQLFDALKKGVHTKSDTIAVAIANSGKEASYARLYPSVDLFAQYNNFSSPTSILPVPPNTLKPMLADQSIPQPFSYNIYKAGVTISMPLFAKSIYTYADKAKAVEKSAQAKKRIDLFKNEALLVGANANLAYVEQMQKALDAKETSLLETKKTLDIKVQNGRSPASALYQIEDNLNEIAITKNQLALQKKAIQSSIESLTSLSLAAAIKMEEHGALNDQKLGALEPLEHQVSANSKELKAQKEKLYPALYANANYSRSMADAYNNDNTLYENYGSVGVMLDIPIFKMDQYEAITQAKLKLRSSQNELEKQRQELASSAKELQASLPLLKDSIRLYKKSVTNKKELLKIAKVNFDSGRLTTEEYLRYEDDLLQAKAQLYKTQAQRWQTLVQLGVIYGNNIEELIR